jgi:hypothetical protein
MNGVNEGGKELVKMKLLQLCTRLYRHQRYIDIAHGLHVMPCNAQKMDACIVMLLVLVNLNGK